MKRSMVACAIGIAVATSGCAGVKFSPDSLNGQAWPEELSERQYFKSAGVYYRNLSGLVGHVLYARQVDGKCPTVYSDANLSLDQYVLPGTKLEPDTTAVERYSDRIDRNASVDASVLTFASKLAATQAAEVVVTDTTTLIIPDSNIDLPRLQQLAREPLEPGDCDRYYIRGAIVTTVTYRTATQVDANATVAGTAFGANSKVFNSARKYSLDFRLGLSVLPVRARMNPAQRGIPKDVEPKALEGISIPETGLPTR